jgi:hypothetical protein
LIRFAAYLIPLAILLGVVYYVYDSQNTIKTLVAKNAILERSNSELQSNLISLKQNIEFQATQLQTLNTKINEANRLAKENLEAFEDSDLNSLSNAKPNLIEKAINDGTNELFKQFETESR